MFHALTCRVVACLDMPSVTRTVTRLVILTVVCWLSPDRASDGLEHEEDPRGQLR